MPSVENANGIIQSLLSFLYIPNIMLKTNLMYGWKTS